jgi:AbrB family looped-hinge helix DNA binding protein
MVGKNKIGRLIMPAVKVFPKGQITLPKNTRKRLTIEEGDTLILEEKKNQVILKKGKTIFDYLGLLPNLGMLVEKIREKAVREDAKEHELSDEKNQLTVARPDHHFPSLHRMS